MASFLGNTDIVERLDTKLREGRLPHALIFSGPEGIGKRTYALRIAKTLNCIGDTETFCDSCTQCEKVSAGTHPDIFFISVEADATRIKIEQVRKLLTMLALRPMEGFRQNLPDRSRGIDDPRRPPTRCSRPWRNRRPARSSFSSPGTSMTCS